MKLLLFLTAIFAVSACDPMHGFTRVAYFESYPPDNCIITTTKTIDGVSEVGYMREVGGRPLTLHGIESPDVIHRYWYTYKNIENDFYFVESFNGRVEFRHGYGCLHCHPSQDVIDTIYPFILELESRLKEQCEIRELDSALQEFCSGNVPRCVKT